MLKERRNRKTAKIESMNVKNWETALELCLFSSFFRNKFITLKQSILQRHNTRWEILDLFFRRITNL